MPGFVTILATIPGTILCFRHSSCHDPTAPVRPSRRGLTESGFWVGYFSFSSVPGCAQLRNYQSV